MRFDYIIDILISCAECGRTLDATCTGGPSPIIEVQPCETCMNDAIRDAPVEDRFIEGYSESFEKGYRSGYEEGLRDGEE